MALEGPDRLFGLWRRVWDVKVCRVCCVEPSPSITIQHPIAPASGVPEFRLESPPVNSPIKQIRGIVLPGRRNHSDAHTQNGLLLPLRELLQRHGWPSPQVYGESNAKI